MRVGTKGFRFQDSHTRLPPLGCSPICFHRLVPSRGLCLFQWGLTALRVSKSIEPGSSHPKYSPLALCRAKMSCSLPQEILDLVIDHLRDEPKTLQTCCVVSKAWVERTRKHLFVQVKFRPLRRRVCRWRETFPDPTNSPARHARTLSICHPQFITAADADTILTFCGVVHLNVDTDLWHDQGVSLALLHGFSPVIRSLHLTFTSLPNSKIFDLVCSLPLLEDLALVSRTHRHSDMPWNPPSTSPRLTGSLELRLIEGIQITTYRLLDFPNGLHFTKIVVLWRSGGDVLSTMHLVSRCSGTLESLDIADHLLSVFPSTPVLD